MSINQQATLADLEAHHALAVKSKVRDRQNVLSDAHKAVSILQAISAVLPALASAFPSLHASKAASVLNAIAAVAPAVLAKVENGDDTA